MITEETTTPVTDSPKPENGQFLTEMAKVSDLVSTTGKQLKAAYTQLVWQDESVTAWKHGSVNSVFETGMFQNLSMQSAQLVSAKSVPLNETTPN